MRTTKSEDRRRSGARKRRISATMPRMKLRGIKTEVPMMRAIRVKNKRPLPSERRTSGLSQLSVGDGVGDIP
jgi:hypothetical protein